MTSRYYPQPRLTPAQMPRPHGLGDGYAWFGITGATALPYRYVAPLYERDTMVQPYSNVPAIDALYRQPAVTLRTQTPMPGARSFMFPNYVGPNYLF